MRTLLSLIAAGLALTAGGPAAAQQAASAPAEAAKSQPEVLVTAQRAELASRVTLFVNQLTDFNFGDKAQALARWQDPACPLVTGLPRKMGEYILKRITDIAQQAGTPLGEEHCRPNLFIIVTKQPQADLRDLQKRHGPEVFGDATPLLVEGFITSPRPVRAWYDTIERTPEGLPLANMDFPGISQQKWVQEGGNPFALPVRPAISPESLTNPWSQASHLVLNVIWVIKRDFVIVDPTRFKGVSLGQLADYVAMAGLAQVRLDNNLADDPTILTLFDRPSQTASAGLTDWDRAFLKSVYATEAKAVLQQTQIARAMVSAIAP